MDYKEKVIALLNDQELSKEQKEKLENIFPELKEKESEDEKIKKDIISYLRNEKIVKRYISDIEVDKWIAWLEKQGETFNAVITNRSDEMLHAISTGLTDVGVELGWSDFGGIPIEEIKDWLEKQGENKLADKVDQSFIKVIGPSHKNCLRWQIGQRNPDIIAGNFAPKSKYSETGRKEGEQ